MEGRAGDVGLGELAPEAGVLDELRGGEVVGVGVFPVGGEEEPGPDRAEDGGQGAAVEQGRLQAPVRQAEVLPPGVPQRGVGRRGLLRPALGGAQGGRLAAGQVEDADLPALRP